MKSYRRIIFEAKMNKTVKIDFTSDDDTTAIDRTRRGYPGFDTRPLRKGESGVTQILRLEGRTETPIWIRETAAKKPAKKR